MKRIAALSLAVVLAAIAIGSHFAIASDAPKPRIAIEHAPAIEGGRTVDGYIWFEGGTGKYGDYAITMALEVTRGGTVWGPKPTYAEPSVQPGGSGRFSCLFATGGRDLSAERLYVYLIPAGFTPNGDISRTEAAALDKVIIDRYAGGRVDIQQAEKPPPHLTAPVPVPANSADQQKHPADTPKLSICYSPYTNGLSPETNSVVPIEQMRWQLNLIYPYADTIRLFGVSGELEKIYKPAKDEYNMRIIAGCWIDGRYPESQIYAELDKLIELANDGYADVAVVGSETIYRNDFTVDRLISYINYVRERITDKSIPVGTSDIPAAFLVNPKLVENCDVILCTIYPFFSNVTADRALQNLADTYDRVKAAAGGRQVIISESGWPTQGSPEGAAVPGVGNAKTFFEESYKWSRDNNVEIVFFSEIDEAWKIEGINGDIGGHWGHFTSVGMLKDAYLPVYQSISPVPVLDAATVAWAENAILELIGIGVLDAGGPSLYEPMTPITRGDFIHYLVKALDLEKNTGRAGATFTDVNPNIYYYYTMGAGQKAGLVLGSGNNMCNPGSNITRQDMFTLIYRALTYAGMDLQPDSGALERFADNGRIADYAKDAVSALTINGLIAGDQNGNVNPRSSASRAEAAVMMHRVYRFVQDMA